MMKQKATRYMVCLGDKMHFFSGLDDMNEAIRQFNEDQKCIGFSKRYHRWVNRAFSRLPQKIRDRYKQPSDNELFEIARRSGRESGRFGIAENSKEMVIFTKAFHKARFIRSSQ